jgi:hypothetical protein
MRNAMCSVSGCLVYYPFFIGWEMNIGDRLAEWRWRGWMDGHVDEERNRLDFNFTHIYFFHSLKKKKES